VFLYHALLGQYTQVDCCPHKHTKILTYFLVQKDQRVRYKLNNLNSLLV
jgi:hypothetical protein